MVRPIAFAPSTLPPVVGAAACLALALFLVTRSGTARRWLALAAGGAALWALAVAIGFESSRPVVLVVMRRGAHLASALGGVGALGFAAALLKRPTRLMVAAGVSAPLAAALLPTEAIWLATVLGLWPPLFAAYLVLRAGWPLPSCRRRRQLGWALGGLGLWALAIAFCFLRDRPADWAVGAAAVLVLSYALEQQRMAPRTFLRHVLLGLIGLGAAAVLVAFVVVVLPRTLTTGGTRLFVVTLAIFIAVRVWMSVAEPALSYLFAWRRRQIERALADFERRSLAARSADEVTLCLAEALREALGAQLLSVLSLEQTQASQWLAMTGEMLGETGEVLFRDLVDLEDPRKGRLLQAFDRLGADAFLPLRRDGQLMALAVVSGAALARADEAVANELRRMGQRAAVAWINARLYDEVARRASGLEAQVRARTAELEGALTELRATQARLLEAERSSSLGLLVAGVSHEINNALNMIHANLPTLVSYADRYAALVGIDDPAAATARTLLPGALADLSDASRRTRAIVEDLRKFARPDTERRLVRVQEGIDAALNLLRRRTDGRLDIVRAYDGAASVEGYPGQLNQCFFNLLLNAVEAARSAVWITLFTRPSGDVELIISDDGAGVAAEHQDRLFQPFFTTKPRAAGLGLPVSHAIVERHGGRLSVESVPGHGARVRLVLPTTAPAGPGA